MVESMKLSLKYIKKFSTRTFAISLSIILSMLLIVGVGILSQSAKVLEVEYLKYDNGNFHVVYSEINKKQLEEIRNTEGIKNIAVKSFYDGFNYNDILFISLNCVDENYLPINNSKIIKGRLPKNENEIALETWVISNLGIKPDLNQTIDVKLENRNERRQYKLVGIIEDIVRNKTAGVTEGIVGRSSEETNTNGLKAYVEFNENVNIMNSTNNLSKKIGLDKDHIYKNKMLIDVLNQTGKIDRNMLFFSILVSFVSAIVIYSIFNISMYQRIKDYGIIRAIGGSKAQIFKLILSELLIISSASIPIGILVGILSAKGLGSIFGKLFTEFEISNLKIIIPKEIILLAVALVLILIIIISAWISSKVLKISPVEAISKNFKSNKKSKKSIFSVNALSKFISFNKILSFKNIERDKKGALITVLSMTMGSILFMVSSYYGNIQQQQINEKLKIGKMYDDYKLVTNGNLDMNAGLSKDEVKKLKNLEGVREVVPYKTLYGRIFLDKDIIYQNFIEFLRDMNRKEEGAMIFIKKDEKSSKMVMVSTLWGLNDESLKNLDSKLLEGNVDLTRMKKKPVAILCTPFKGNRKIIDANVGDTIRVSFRKDGEPVKGFWTMEDEGEYVEQEFLIGGIITYDDFPTSDDYYSAYGLGADMIVSENIFDKLSGFKPYRIITVNKEKGYDNRGLEKKIISIARQGKGVTVRDFTTQRKEMNKYGETKMTFLYVISLVLFIISMFNIINNISYSLISRTGEFGMIRAVGLTNKEFRQMIRTEGIFYGMVSSIFSLIIGISIEHRLYEYHIWSIENPRFILQWKTYVLVVCVNILIGLLSTYIPSRKIKKLSIVESINAVE